MTDDAAPTTDKLSPTSLPVATLAQILSRLGGVPITTAMIEDDLAKGAPSNADGTLNLVHYVAWLVKGMGRGD